MQISSSMPTSADMPKALLHLQVVMPLGADMQVARSTSM
jgi:hypothetical protein